MVQEEDKNKLLDLNVFGGAREGVSDHQLVVGKIRFLRKWIGRMVRMEERYEIKLSELNKVTCKTEYLYMKES